MTYGKPSVARRAIVLLFENKGERLYKSLCLQLRWKKSEDDLFVGDLLTTCEQLANRFKSQNNT